MPATQQKCIYGGLTLDVERHYIGSVTDTTHHLAFKGTCIHVKCSPHLFPLLCEAGSTVPSEGFDSGVIMPFSWCVVADTSYIVSVHIQCQASIYTLSLCRGHSWRVWLAKQETLTPPWHLVSPLVCRGA